MYNICLRLSDEIPCNIFVCLYKGINICHHIDFMVLPGMEVKYSHTIAVFMMRFLCLAAGHVVCECVLQFAIHKPSHKLWLMMSRNPLVCPANTNHKYSKHTANTWNLNGLFVYGVALFLWGKCVLKLYFPIAQIFANVNRSHPKTYFANIVIWA